MHVRIRFVALICAVLLVSSCGMTVQQKEAIDTFGEATAAVGTFCEEELAFIKQDVTDMAFSMAAIDTSFTSKKIEERRAFVNEKNTAARIAAGRALRSSMPSKRSGRQNNEPAEARRAGCRFLVRRSGVHGYKAG